MLNMLRDFFQGENGYSAKRLSAYIALIGAFFVDDPIPFLTFAGGLLTAGTFETIKLQEIAEREKENGVPSEN